MKTEITNYLKSLLIPIGIILLGIIVGRIFFNIIENWAWLPIVLSYWAAVGIVIYFDFKKTGKKPSDYFKGIKFKISALMLALLVGLIPLLIFVKNFHLINTWYLIILSILFAFINPFFEEVFWRAYMLDKFKKIPFGIKALVSSIFFAVSHPLVWGMFSSKMLTIEMFISVFIMGIVWTFIYYKTKSILLPYVSHVLVNILSCSILAFLNLLPVMTNL